MRAMQFRRKLQPFDGIIYECWRRQHQGDVLITLRHYLCNVIFKHAHTSLRYKCNWLIYLCLHDLWHPHSFFASLIEWSFLGAEWKRLILAFHQFHSMHDNMPTALRNGFRSSWTCYTTSHSYTHNIVYRVNSDPLSMRCNDIILRKYARTSVKHSKKENLIRMPNKQIINNSFSVFSKNQTFSDDFAQTPKAIPTRESERAVRKNGKCFLHKTFPPFVDFISPFFHWAGAKSDGRENERLRRTE